MPFKLYQIILHVFVVHSVAFEDLIYVYGDGNKEMNEQGRAQYQLIKERGTLPKYGSCWKSALEHLNEGCRHLSEDTQSDVALHLANCFLEMSGHETYNCLQDKKPNLRGICINNMSDRAFNVYTEFYTHVQNICWFLRGQIWHETIAENTLVVGKQLKVAAELQQESVRLQEKMLERGKLLEGVLDRLYESTQNHQEVLQVLARSVHNLQWWIIGEISWIDSILFNTTVLVLIFITTSTKRTAEARLLLILLLFLNIVTERFICKMYSNYQHSIDTATIYNSLYSFVWYSRYAFILLGIVVLVYISYNYQDIMDKNLSLLDIVRQQNDSLMESMERLKRGKTPSTSLNYITESEGLRDSKSSDTDYMTLPNKYDKKQLKEPFTIKYNLRSYSRQGTPDSGVVNDK